MFTVIGASEALHRARTSSTIASLVLAAGCTTGGTHPPPDAGPPPPPPDAGPPPLPCEPDRYECLGDRIARCASDGSHLEALERCDATAGTVCMPGFSACQSPCALAETNDSYVGCEYWPVTTVNHLIGSEHLFAVAIASGSSWRAEVAITRGDDEIARVAIEPGALEYVTLPAVDALTQHEHPVASSALEREGAYRLRSTMPITVYQFNPFEDAAPGAELSYSADASLLLPTHVLGDEYLVLGWRAEVVESAGVHSALPAFANIVAAEDATVRIVAPTPIGASLDGVVHDTAAGEEVTYELEAGDALQILGAVPTDCEVVGHQGLVGFCDLGAIGDLTGTRIRATGRIQVIAGNSCAMVPFDRIACDHLEETVPPLATWGVETAIAPARHHEAQDHYVRILSSRDDNELRFEPAVHEPVVLDAGEMLELALSSGFHLSSDHPILVAQFLSGQGLHGDPLSTTDPSMTFAPPVEQFRAQYRFIAPQTYPANFINVVGPAGLTAELDGVEIGPFEALGDSGYVAARVRVAAGAHDLTSSAPSSVTAYGYSSYTSYLYPAGLDVRPLLE
jgi:hypothetical protein